MRRAPKAVSLVLSALVAVGGSLAHGQNLPPPPTVPAAGSGAAVPAPAPDVAPVEPAAEIAPPPTEPLPEPRVTYQRRYNMAILGAGLLLATWGADRLLTRDLNSPYKEPPWIPIIGPWFLLYGQTNNTTAPNRFTMSLLVFDGLLQAGGLTVAILGFALHKKRLTISLPPAPPRVTP